MANEELKRKAVQQEQAVGQLPADMTQQLINQILSNTFVSDKSQVSDTFFQDLIAQNIETLPTDQKKMPMPMTLTENLMGRAPEPSQTAGLGGVPLGLSREEEETGDAMVADLGEKIGDPEGQKPLGDKLISDDIVKKIEKSIKGQNEGFIGDNLGSLMALLAGTALQMVGLHNRKADWVLGGGVLSQLGASQIGRYGQAKRQERTGIIEEHLMQLRGDIEERRFTAAEEREERKESRREKELAKARMVDVLKQMKSTNTPLTPEKVEMLREQFPVLSDEEFKQQLNTYDLYAVDPSKDLTNKELERIKRVNQTRLDAVVRRPDLFMKTMNPATKKAVKEALDDGDLFGAQQLMKGAVETMVAGESEKGSLGITDEQYQDAASKMLNIGVGEEGELTVESPVSMGDLGQKGTDELREYNATVGSEYIRGKILKGRLKSPNVYMGTVQFDKDEVKDITLAKFASASPTAKRYRTGGLSQLFKGHVPSETVVGSTEPLSALSAMNNLWGNLAKSAVALQGRGAGLSKHLYVHLRDEENQATPKLVKISNIPFTEEVSDEEIMRFLDQVIKTDGFTTEFNQELSKLFNETIEWSYQ